MEAARQKAKKLERLRNRRNESKVKIEEKEKFEEQSIPIIQIRQDVVKKEEEEEPHESNLTEREKVMIDIKPSILEDELVKEEEEEVPVPERRRSLRDRKSLRRRR